jgi:nucleoside-diphosphate-sugar epimerase
MVRDPMISQLPQLDSPKSNDLASSYRDATTLVTGGAGFIGSNLVRRLLVLNVGKVTVLDDLSSSYSWNLPRDRRVQFVQGSILDDEKLTSAFESRPQYVFHLAAHFANQNSVDHPEQDLMANGMGTLRVLRLARIADAKRFVFASSGCSVYGSDAPLPLKEDFVSIRLDTPYQITKLLGELYCNYFSDLYGMKVSIPRFFNVYGPGEVPGSYRNVIPNFIYWALNRNPLPITGTGDETRDFTYVEDIVEGILKCGFVERAVGEAMNLASGVETRIIDLAKSINKLTENAKGVIMQPKRDWDKSTRRRASIEKAKRLIEYRPSTTLESGLNSTLAWFRKQWGPIQKDARF